jgi:hypothetical protein
MNANAQLSISKQLQDRAPWIASLKVEHYSESVINRILYVISSHLIEGNIELTEKSNGLPVMRWEVRDMWTWEVEGTRIHKRIKAAIYKRTGYNLPDALLRNIAEIAATDRNSNDTWVDVTTDFSWESGDFGDDGSCYWGSYSNARTSYLPKLAASAVRSYETYDNGQCGHGTGRGWIYPVPFFKPENADLAVYVAFNPYGTFGNNHSLFGSICAMAASDQNGKPYKWARLYDHNVDGCYVNGCDFLIYPSDLDLATILSEECISDLIHSGETKYNVNVSYDQINRVGCPLPTWAKRSGASDYEVRRPRCVSCGDRYDENDGNWEDGDFYCEDCYNETFSYCEFCEETVRSEDCHNVDDHYICEYCRNRYATQCDRCNEYHVTSAPRYHRADEYSFYDVNSDGCNETWCADCFEGNVFHCDVCDVYYDDRYMDAEMIGRDCHCTDCAETRHAQDAAEAAEAAEDEMIEASPNVLTGFIVITDAKPGYVNHYGEKIYNDVVSGGVFYLTPMFAINGDLSPTYVLTYAPDVIPF